MPTFDDLGIPFPLYKAPIETASDYAGVHVCELCHRSGHCFRINDYVLRDCSQCGATNALYLYDRPPVTCRQCQQPVDFSDIDSSEVLACYTCVRGGKVCIVQDTEFGMVSWEQLLSGVTHGIPGLENDEMETVPLGDGWVGVKLDKSILEELTRTPNYSTVQGEHWLFCCGQPMPYIGEWTNEDFHKHAPDGDGRAFFDSVLEDSSDEVWEGDLHDSHYIYVHQCSQCQRYRAYWDMF